MNKFSHIIHPIDKYDLAKHPPFGIFTPLPEQLIAYLSAFFPPMPVAKLSNIQSTTGAEAEGYIIACPLTAKRMVTMQTSAYPKIVASCKHAYEMGAKIVGLGAFTSVIGDAGVSIVNILERSNIPINVTTGNSYAVGLAIKTVESACEKLDIDLAEMRVAVFGAGGSIGSGIARLIAGKVKSIALVSQANKVDTLRSLADNIRLINKDIHIERSANLGFMKDIQIGIFATSATQPLINLDNCDSLQAGSIMCDIALPRNIHPSVLNRRRDVLFIDGDKAELPHSDIVKYKPDFNFGFDQRVVFGCLAEVIILALEGKFENYTLGRNLTVDKIVTIMELGSKHGFSHKNLYSFNRIVSDEYLEIVRQRITYSRQLSTTIR